MSNVQKLLRLSESKETVTRARERFAWKPFHERYKTLRGLALAGRFLLPVLSIITGIFFLSVILNGVLPWWTLSISLSGLLLGGWEFGKAQLITLSVENHYSGRKTGIAMGIIALLFSVGSAYMSVRGAMSIHQTMDTALANLQSKQVATLDSVQHYYDGQIEQLQWQISDIEQHKSERWGGLLSASENKQILNIQEQIKQVRAERSEKLTNVPLKQSDTFRKAQEKADFNLWAVACIALLIDSLIILCGWYLVWFDFQTAKESDRLQVSERVDLSLQDVRQVVQHLQLVPDPLPQLEVKNQPGKIGFALGTARPEKSKESDKNHNFGQVLTGADTSTKQDVTGAIAAIRAGAKDRRYLMRSFRLNVQTANQLVAKYG